MIVGDSIRASLRQLTIDRLGKIDYAISGPRFFHEQFADAFSKVAQSEEKLAQPQWAPSVPAIVMQSGLQLKSGTKFRRAGKVNVYGFDQRAWPLIETNDIALPAGSHVILNSRAAAAIDAKVGDEVTLWIELPSAIPRDTLLGNKDNDSQEITLKVSAIAPDSSGLGRLGLQPTQSLPLNAFVDLHVLQERLGLEEVRPSRRDPNGRPARVNAMFVNSESATSSIASPGSETLSEIIQRSWTLGAKNDRRTRSDHVTADGLPGQQNLESQYSGVQR